MSNAFSHASCNRVDIEHEMTVTIAAGILKKAFGLFTYSAVGTSFRGPNKKAADKQWGLLGHLLMRSPPPINAFLPI